MVGAREDGAAKSPVATLAAIPSEVLPRRILFHPPLNAAASPSPSSTALALTPLNDPPPPPSTVINADPRHKPESSSKLQQSQIRLQQPLQSTPIARIGAGLSNLGNTCFLNSVLQCLTYTPALAAYLQAGLHKESCRVAGFCAMCALESHVKQALSAPGRVISPNHLVKNLRCISRSFQMWRQEDAHEYMRYLIEALQKCCPKEASSSSITSYKSYIQKVFSGRLRSQVKCTQCSYCSNTYDPFLDLSLEIVRAESLVKALARFTAVEVLDGDNKYQCSKCKKKVRALKQFTIDHAPHVLTVQFKRFSSSGGYGGKIDKKVHFDRTLDLKPFVNGAEDGELKYSLYAVLVHSGWSTHSGHYYCFVRTATDMWHVLDDSRVSQVSEKTVLEQKAYILFYTRNVKAPAKAGPNIKINNSNFSEAKIHGNGTPVTVRNHEVNGNTTKVKGNGCIGTETKAISSNGLANGNLTMSLENINGNTSKVKGNACIGTETKAISSNGLANGNSIMALEKVNGNTSKVKGNGYIGTETKAISRNGLANGNSTMARIDATLSSYKEAKDVSPRKGSVNGSAFSSTAVPADAASKLSQQTTPVANVTTSQINGNGSLFTNGNLNSVSQNNVTVQSKLAAVQTTSSANGQKLRNSIDANSKENTIAIFTAASLCVSVPRWGDEARAEQNGSATQMPPEETPAHCGHVLDKWDEEYDKGKRKKVKNKSSEQAEDLAVHLQKKRKSTHDEGNTVLPNGESCQQVNPFQAAAGSKSEVRIAEGRQFKKSKRKQPAFGHKLFLKRHRFKQLGRMRQHRKKR